MTTTAIKKGARFGYREVVATDARSVTFICHNGRPAATPKKKSEKVRHTMTLKEFRALTGQ